MLVAVAAPAEAIEFYQTADRVQVGTEDTFRLTVVMSDAPDDAKEPTFPSSNDFEVLAKAQSTQMSYTLGAGGVGTIKRVQRWTLTMRANRVGQLTIPPSVLTAGGKTHKTEAIKLDVVKGRTNAPPQQRPNRPTIQTPFGPMPVPTDPNDDPFQVFPTPDVPRSDSDLFLRSSVDKDEVFVGEQVMFTLVLFSRVDAANVDNVSLPRLDGVWVEDLDSPTRLVPEHKEINGIPYRAYVVMRRALFPMKAGTVQITPAEADITTGMFFNGTRVHRRSNPISLKVKALPAAGAPPGVKVSMVGKWRLAVEASQTKVALGEPVQVKVTLEGKGNLKDATVPLLKGPQGVKVYDPTTTDKMSATRTVVSGKRTVEYVVLPQQTGKFTLPGLSLWYFNPENQKYEETKTDPIELTIGAGSGGEKVIGNPNAVAPLDPTQKNRLEAGGLKPLRHTGVFAAPRKPLHQTPWFLALAAAPLGLALAFSALGAGRRALGATSPGARRRMKTKEARRRLAGAEKMLGSAKPADFYNEVEKAVTGFLDARLQVACTGLTRDALEEKLKAGNCPEDVRKKIRAVLDTCDMGRFAPGMGEATARNKALEDAAVAMGAWD
jgi:BatD DUF11 like domain